MARSLSLLAQGFTGIVSAVIDTSHLPNTKSSPNNGTVTTILNIVFAMSASIAVLIIVIGGFRYILARGDPSAVAGARNTVLYALVGLIVVMAAYSIVVFVVKGIG